MYFNNKMASHLDVYYALTDKEVKAKKIVYKRNSKYNGKGVNLTKKGLIKFINDNQLNDICKYYTIIPLSKFTVIESIEYDKEYDMIAVETPFEIEFEKVYKL